ncbi:Sodium-and chloride-dependent neutral and basic amino acid transporter B(0+) [Nibea albiflora]|uniref:Sodium-and chloride-dependent neutral and basic amino acid transporter B(0+) n=1 Tax=Nibea albiflora TaxID=240163 RepID=A0ACB7F095_NIBAL|nr:Sodium-and chloride-dependent neutral and basic amino acid transporter B(0+) [Nibea albiflora]
MKEYGWTSFRDLIFRNPAVVDQDPHVDDGDENHERGNWSTKKEYILSTIGYAVGLGNIWRFPYLAYKNGGAGAFLIPYFVMLVVTGIPLFFLESAFGQFCSQGPINVWRAVPLMQGVGIAMVMVTLIVSVYYNVIISYSVYYMFASFQSPLPWSGCLTNCSNTTTVSCNVSGVVVANWTQDNTTCPSSNTVQSPSEQYWDHVALQRSSGLDETGPIVWHLALCLLFTSMLVAAALIRGIKSSGKVVYFTATFPYVVILILLVRGVTLEGARDGIEYYIGSQSNLTKLTEPQVWKDAATQTFFSLSIGWGGVMTLASYNNFHNNMFKDSFVVSLTNAGTSVLAGFAIFSILGHMAHVYKVPVGEVVKEGFGLAFIAYPDALSKLPISPLWSALFFFMILTVGLDSQFAGIEVITTCLVDAFPKIFKSRRGLLTISTCSFLYLLGLPCVTRAGIYWVTLIDQFVASWVLLFLGLFEIIGVCYIYGGNRFIKDIEMMLGNKSFIFWLWWRTCWFFLSPCVTVVILVWSLINFEPPSYGAIQFPDWGLALGWCMAVFCLLWIPGVAVYKLLRAEGSPQKRLKSLCSPAKEWRPYLDVHRGEQECHANDGDENPERGNWTNKTEQMLSMIGYAVGLGNIWRFPYLAYRNGGAGAFLIPYFLMLPLCGIPLFFLESAFSQFCSQGPVNVWRAVPLLQGVGLSITVLCLLLAIYYNVIVAYSLYYMFASFQSPLPWSSCFSWADSRCSSVPSVSCNVSGVVVANWTQENITCPPSSMITVQVQSPSEQYWDHVALQRSSGLDETGPIVWHLALCLLLSTALVAAVLIRGIKSSGKVWKDAASQNFFSIGIAFGGLMTQASYANFHNNIVLDSFVITFINHSTSVFAGLAIFSILGHMAHVYGKPVGAVVKEGFGLAFIAYPEALAKLPLSSLWSFLFFFMLVLVGLDSQFTQLEVIITCLCDALPEVTQLNRAFLTVMSSFAVFLLGLPCVSRIILVWSLITFVPPTYGAVQYPTWGLALGWCMIASILIWIPAVAVYKLIRAEGSLWKRLVSLCSPTDEWHPYLDTHRGERYSKENCSQSKAVWTNDKQM